MDTQDEGRTNREMNLDVWVEGSDELVRELGSRSDSACNEAEEARACLADREGGAEGVEEKIRRVCVV